MNDTVPQEPDMKFAIDLARLADQTRCHNVVVLDVRKKSPVTKYFLIATGTSDRQRRTVGDELIAHGKLNGFPAWRSNGYETAKWIVVDFVDVVVHIFEEASRNFYDLEMLWGDCPRVTWQLPQPETAVPSSASFGASQPRAEMAQIESMTGAPTARDSDADVDSQGSADQTPEPQVEEFIDEHLLVAHVTDDNELIETASVKIVAVAAVPERPTASKEKRKVAAAKPAAKIASKPAGKVKARVGAKAPAKAKIAAPAKLTTRPARGSKPPAVKKAKAKAKAKAATGRSAKPGKLLKSRAVKPVVKGAKTARPGAKKAGAKRSAAKKITRPQSAAKKARSKAAAGEKRGTAAKPLKKPAAKTKKR